MGWRTVRVFISSTFLDMQAERDHLVRFVFPRLREQLQRQRIHLVDVDLRWGVTSERDATEVCREIINECEPRFLCILGGRYGWIPPGHSTSITAQEVTHVLANSPLARKHLFFYFRSPEATNSIPENIAVQIGYREFDNPEKTNRYGEQRRPVSAAERTQKLEALKESIITAGSKPFVYSAHWDDKTGRLAGLEEFGERVSCDILRSIQDQFGTQAAPAADKYAEQNAAIDSFVEERVNQFVLGDRVNVISSLQQHVNGPADGCFFLSGQPGSGKTALLAYFCRQFAGNPGPTQDLFIPHFAGCYPGSTNVVDLLARVVRELEYALTGSAHPLPTNVAELKSIFWKQLSELPAGRKLILLIDGIDRMEGAEEALDMTWLPAPLPGNLRLIVGGLDCQVVDSMRRRLGSLHEIVLHPLSKADAGKIVETYLARYHKEMEAVQRDMLLSKPDAGNPLYLISALEELRTVGTHDQLSDRVQQLPGTLRELFTWIIHRLEEDPGFRGFNGAAVGAVLVHDYLSTLAASRHGLSYRELTEILGCAHDQGNIAALTRLLRPHLSYRGELIILGHAEFQGAVEALYWRNERAKIQAHARLVEHFRKQADPIGAVSSEKGGHTWSGTEPRAFRELPYHVRQSHDFNMAARLVRTGFLDREAQVAGQDAAYADSRALLEALSDSEADWEDLRLGARQYCDLAERIHRTSNNLEELILQGDLHRLRAILETVPTRLDRQRLQYAVSVLAAEVGRHDIARIFQIEPDPECETGHEISEGSLAIYLALRNPAGRAEGLVERWPPFTQEVSPGPNSSTAIGIQYIPVLDVALTSGLCLAALTSLSTILFGSILTALFGSLHWLVWLVLAFPGVIAGYYLRVMTLHWLYSAGSLQRILDGLLTGAHSAKQPEADAIRKRIVRYSHILHRVWWGWDALRSTLRTCDTAALEAASSLLEDTSDPSETVTQLLSADCTIDLLAGFLSSKDRTWVEDLFSRMPAGLKESGHTKDVLLRSRHVTVSPRILRLCMDIESGEVPPSPQVEARRIAMLPRLTLARAFTLPPETPNESTTTADDRPRALVPRIMERYRRLWTESFQFFWEHRPAKIQPWRDSIMLNPIEKAYRRVVDGAWALVSALGTLWICIGLFVIALPLMALAFSTFMPFILMTQRRWDSRNLASIGYCNDSREFRASVSQRLLAYPTENELLEHTDPIQIAVVAAEIIDRLRDKRYVARLQSHSPKLVIWTVRRLLGRISHPHRLFGVLASSCRALSQFTEGFPTPPGRGRMDLPGNDAAVDQIRRALPAERTRHAWSLAIGTALTIAVWFAAAGGTAPYWLLLPMAATAVVLIVRNTSSNTDHWTWIIVMIAFAVCGLSGLILFLFLSLAAIPATRIPFWIPPTLAAIVTVTVFLNGAVQDLRIEWQGGSLLFPTRAALWRKRCLCLAVLALVPLIAGVGWSHSPLASVFLPGVWVWGLALARKSWPTIV